MRGIMHESKTYFTEEELRCKGSGLLILAEGFAEKLLELRLIYGKPMPVTSACRSTLHNAAVGGAPKSYHICDSGRGCCAVDVRTKSVVEAAALARAALDLGWSVGVNKAFLHLDRRVDHGAKQSLFTY